jgi:hypothetical protein
MNTLPVRRKPPVSADQEPGGHQKLSVQVIAMGINVYAMKYQYTAMI